MKILLALCALSSSLCFASPYYFDTGGIEFGSGSPVNTCSVALNSVPSQLTSVMNRQFSERYRLGVRLETDISGKATALPGYECRTTTELFWVLREFPNHFVIVKAPSGITRALIVHLGSSGLGLSWQSVENLDDLSSILAIAEAVRVPVVEVEAVLVC